MKFCRMNCNRDTYWIILFGKIPEFTNLGYLNLPIFFCIVVEGMYIGMIYLPL